MFEMFLWWLVTFLISDYFRPSLPEVEPSGEGDFQSPTATEGRKIPQVCGGTVRMKSPNTLFQGDWDYDEVTIETGVVFKRDETVAYAYKISLALGMFIGETAGMTAIWIGDDKVWDYVTDNSSVPASVADVDLPELFGGETQGGGFRGRFRAFLGTSGQSVSSFLASRVPLQSAWPGLTYVVMTDLTETEGATFGEANSLRNITIEWQMFDTVANGGLGDDLSLGNDEHFIGRDANPISVAYKVLNDPIWGINTNEINFTNFQTIASQIYTEGIGFSMLVDSEQEAYEVLDEIEKHIDGYIGPNPNSGSIEIKLARDDYTPASEFQATEANIKEIQDYSKPEWPQTKNEVKIRFVNRDKEYKDDHAIAQDMASRVITGRPQSVTTRYPGLRDATAANKIVARVSRTYFWPVAKFRLIMDRTAYAIRPGDVVVVTHPDIDATNLACRVTRVRTGDPIDQTIKLDCVVDVFKDETGVFAAPPGSEHVPPSSTNVLPSNYTQILAPRFLMALNEQILEPRVLHLVQRDAPNNAYGVRYEYRATFGGGSFSAEFPTGPFQPFTKYGTLRANGVSSPELGLDHLQDTVNTGLATVSEGGVMYVDGSLSSLVGSYLPDTNFDGLAVINPGANNEEYVMFTTVTANGAGIECAGLIRGIASPIHQHAVGEPVWFLDQGAYMEPNRIPGDLNYGIRYKMRAYGPGGEGPEETSFGTEINVTDGAYNRPDPPTAIIFTQLSSTIWYQDGILDASEPNSFTAPTGQGIALQQWNRKYEQDNPVKAAASLDDGGFAYGTNVFADRQPIANWYIYDLDQTPNPVRGQEVVSGSTAVLDDRVNSYIIDQSLINTTPGLTTPLNARLEFGWQNTGSPEVDGVTPGNESDTTFVDRVITFHPAEFTYEMAQVDNTLLLLHFTGETGSNIIYDYSFHNHPITIFGDPEISQTVADDDFSGNLTSPINSPQEQYPPGHLHIPITSPSTGNYVEVTDVSPKALSPANMSESAGYMVQCRVYLTATPSGFIPLVTRWRTSDNERAFWFGLNSATMRAEHSNDGITALAEATGNLSWNTGQWYELTWTVNDAYIQYWRDGSLVATDFHSWGTMHESAASVRIGADGDGNQPTQEIRIDEVRITKIPVYRAPWTKHLRPYAGRELETTLLINWENSAGSPDPNRTYITDDLNRMPVGFPGSGTTDTRITNENSKWGNNSCYMNGQQSSSGVDFNDGVWIDNTGNTEPYGALQTDGRYKHITDFDRRDFTMEIWVNWSSLPSTAPTGHALISKYHRNLSVSSWGDMFWEIDQLNRMYFDYRGSYLGLTNYDTGDIDITAQVSPFTTGVWYHMAVCRKDGNLSMFFNGTRIYYDSSGAADIPILNAYPSRLSIGRRYSTSSGTTRHRTIHGYVDEVRITNGIAHYDGATYTVPTGPFPVPVREPDTAPLSPQSPQGPPSPQSPQGPSPQSPQGVSPVSPTPLPSPQSPQGSTDSFVGSEGGWEPDDL